MLNAYLYSLKIDECIWISIAVFDVAIGHTSWPCSSYILIAVVEYSQYTLLCHHRLQKIFMQTYKTNNVSLHCQLEHFCAPRKFQYFLLFCKILTTVYFLNFGLIEYFIVIHLVSGTNTFLQIGKELIPIMINY